ncbi:uncharacterized protein [Centruroides vittatus]|uniref:uncharacterized protein n=1 Tax=Centruroides vittatus TaxID=120091 RepID=UPI00350ED030
MASKRKSVLDPLKKDLNEEEEKRKISKQTAQDSTHCDLKNLARQTSATSETKKEETCGNKRVHGREMEEVKNKSKQKSISDFTSLIKSCYVILKREDVQNMMMQGGNVTSKRDGKDQNISSKLSECENVFKSSSLELNREKKDELSDKQVERKAEKVDDVNECGKIKRTNVRTFSFKNDNAKKVGCSSTGKEQSQKPKWTPTDAKLLNNEDFKKDEKKTSETDLAEKRTKEVQSKTLANKTKLTHKKSLVGQDVTSKRQLIKEEDESVNRSVNKEELTEQISRKVVVEDKNENISIVDQSSKDKNRSLSVKDQNKGPTDKVSWEEQCKDVDKSINKDQELKKQTHNISCGKDQTENNKKSADKEDLVKEEIPKKQLSQTENKARKLRRLQINTQPINNNNKAKVKSTIKPPSPVKKGSGSQDSEEVNIKQEQSEEKLKIKSSATENKESESPIIGKIQNINRNDSSTRQTEHSSINKSKCTKTTTNVLNLKRKTEDSGKEKPSNASANKTDQGKVSSKTNTNSAAISIKKDTKIPNKKDELPLKSNENNKKECVESLNHAKLSNKRLKVCETKKQSTEEGKLSPEKSVQQTKVSRETKINDTPTVGQDVTVETPPFQIRKLKRNNIAKPRILKSETTSKSTGSFAENSSKGSSLSASHLSDDDKKDGVAKTNKGINDDDLSKDKNIENVVKNCKETTSDTVSKKEKQQNQKLCGVKIFTIKDNIRITKDTSDPSNRRISVVKESRTLKRSRDQCQTALAADTLQNSKGDEGENVAASADKKIKTVDKSESIQKGDDKVGKSITSTDDTIKSIAMKVLKNITKFKPKKFCEEKNDTEVKSTDELIANKPENANNSEKLQKSSNVKRKMEENSDKSCDSEKNRVEKCVKKPFKIEEDNSCGFSNGISSLETEGASNNMQIDDLIINNNAANEDKNCQLLPLILDVRQVSSSEWELSDSLDVTKISEIPYQNENEESIYGHANKSDSQISTSPESYDKYFDLREQFNNAGINLEDAIQFIDVEKLKSAVKRGKEDACVLLGRTHCCQFSGQIVKPSLVVIKSYKKFTEAKDRVWCRRYGVKQSRVVLNCLQLKCTDS